MLRKNSRFSYLSLLLAATAISRAAGASEHKSTFDPESLHIKWMTNGEYQQRSKKAVERGNRKVASKQTITDDTLSPDMKNFRKRFLGITTAEQITPLLDELDKNYDTYADDLKFVAANLIPLRAFRSFIYKCVPMLSKKAKVTHSILLAQVQEMAAMQGVFLPTQQWKAGFDYVTQPFLAHEEVFYSLGNAQDYLANVVYRELMVSADRIQHLNFEQHSIVWDNQLLYGSAAFADDVDRYRMIGEPERYLTLASMHSSLHNIAMSRAYNADRYFEMVEALGKLWGVSAFIWNPVDGATSQSRVGVVRRFSSNFVLASDGAVWTKRAFTNLTLAVDYQDLAWSELQLQPESSQAVISAGLFKTFTRENGLALENLKAMIQGPKELHSVISRKTIVVDLPTVYSNPPASLQSFLPTQFQGGTEFISKRVPASSGATADVSYRDYFKGRATAWDVKAYQPYFPKLTQSEDVADAARLLSQVWGGGLAAVPIAAFIQ